MYNTQSAPKRYQIITSKLLSIRKTNSKTRDQIEQVSDLSPSMPTVTLTIDGLKSQIRDRLTE